MDYRRLGRSGIEVSALALGSWNTFEYMPEQDALDVLTVAVEAGVTFLDDARYDDRSGKAPLKTGYSEVVFGNLLRAAGFPRDRLFISNRLWFEFHPEQSIAAEVDASLERIGIDYFDLVFCYTLPESVAPTELVEELDSLVAAGKVRNWASANWPVELVAECCAFAARSGLASPTAAMLPYSVLIRSYVEDDAVERVLGEYDIAVVASFALHGGVLTGKYNAPTAPITVRRDAESIAALGRDGTLAQTARFMSLAMELGCPPAQLALAYCLKHPHVASVLFGATSVSQLEENLGALDVLPLLDDELLERVRIELPHRA